MKTPEWNDCNGKINLDYVYECPMIRKGTHYPFEVEDVVKFKFKPYTYGKGYNLIPLDDNHLPKFFYDLYIDWLFYTGYVKRVE